MGLYLCAMTFENSLENELFGVEVGLYDYFGCFRDQVIEKIEQGQRGSVCPVLMMHSDCDGFISPIESLLVVKELDTIRAAFKKLPPDASMLEMREGIVDPNAPNMTSLYDCITDIDGCNLIERLTNLFTFAAENNVNVYFQ